MGVKGIWESTSIALTMGSILFIYWIFSFDLIKIRELAEERNRNDNVNIYNILNENNNNIREEFINNIDNNRN